MHDAMFTSKSAEWSTPQDFFDNLHDEFDFTIDAAASETNTKLPRFFTAKDDALSRSWLGERVWLNPPYGRGSGLWIEKAAKSDADLVVMLIPARTDTRAWHEHIFGKAEIRFVPGRLRFGDAKWAAPFPCAVVIWDRRFKV